MVARTPPHSLTSLDVVYDQVEETILRRQNPVTGLFPASTAVLASGDYSDAWVRDNVYSIVAVWALLKALGRNNYKPKRQERLANAVQSCMRGLLKSMRSQSDKIEAFKCSRDVSHALHAKFALKDGSAVVADNAWGHLQLDSKALFVLFCAQFTEGGLNIVSTEEEFALLQNLVHYVSATASTPDFGVWERGRKTNHGQPEVNNSSVGLALAALRAAGRVEFSVLGAGGSSLRRLWVSEDDKALMLDRLELLLPDESLSKPEDGALLSVLGYPGFAPLRPERLAAVRQHLDRELKRSHGYLRFRLDGHQSWNEDHDRLHYDSGELENFRDWEAQWPLFDAFAYLDANVRGAMDEAEAHRVRLENALIGSKDDVQLPELYFEVPDQGMQHNANLPLVWASSLYTAGRLMQEGWILPKDLDPLNLRHRDGVLSLSPKLEVFDEVPAKRPYWTEFRKSWQLVGGYSDLGITGRSGDALGPLEIFGKAYVHEAELAPLGGVERLRRALNGATSCMAIEVSVLQSDGAVPEASDGQLSALEEELARFAVQRLTSLGCIVVFSGDRPEYIDERHPSHARLGAWITHQRSQGDFRPARLAIQLMLVSLANVNLFATDLVFDLGQLCDMAGDESWSFEALLADLSAADSDLRLATLGLSQEFYITLHGVLSDRSAIVIGASFDQDNWLNSSALTRDCLPTERLFRRMVNARLAKIEDLEYRARTIGALAALDPKRTDAVILSDNEVRDTPTKAAV